MNPMITLIHSVNNLITITKQIASEYSTSCKSNCANIPPSVTPIPAGNKEIPPNNVDEIKINKTFPKSSKPPKASKMKNTPIDSKIQADLLKRIDLMNTFGESNL